jgi:hypothetical protein
MFTEDVDGAAEALALPPPTATLELVDCALAES